MVKYFLRRLLISIPVILGISVVLFAILALVSLLQLRLLRAKESDLA